MVEHGAPRVIPGVLGTGGAGPEPDLGPLFFVVGAFDGLHRGHTYLLRRLREVAARHGSRPGVITFDHHPDEVLVGAAPPVLCDPLERLVRFGRVGVAVVVVQHFDATVRMTPFQDFVAAIAGRVELAGFLMTPDAAFGHERRGTPTTLAALGRQAGFAVEVVEPFDIDGHHVRSNEIRAEIARGELQAASHLLGRSVAVVGRPEGVGADRSHGLVPVAFELPVALPPTGRYRVDLEPAWTPGRARAARRSPSIAVVDPAGSLSLEVRRPAALPAADRLRIRLIGQASR